MLHISLIFHERYLMLAMDSVVKQKHNEKCKIVKRLGILYIIPVVCCCLSREIQGGWTGYEIIQCGT